MRLYNIGRRTHTNKQQEISQEESNLLFYTFSRPMMIPLFLGKFLTLVTTTAVLK